MSQPPTPPPQPITKIHPHPHPHVPLLRSQPAASLPELFFTALSLLFLFSPPSSSSSTSSSASASSSKKTIKIPFLSCPFNPRRFLKIPTMSRHNPTSDRLRRFATPQSLSDWLQPRLPSDSFASWGVKPGTKNVHNLWLELFEGETSLADSIPPVRTVNVVTVRVISGGDSGHVLIESHQELSDGSIRERCRPLSEKMKPGETPEMAVIRAVKEELGSAIQVGSGDVVRIVPGSYKMKVEERNSVSYPGLPACYVLHSFDAWIEGLPEGEFCTEEEEEYANFGDVGAAEKAVSVKRHYWKWVSADSIES